MRNYQLVFLGLLLFMQALLTGQLFHQLLGEQQAIAMLDAPTYVGYWQSLDKIMHVVMPVITNFSIFIFLLNLFFLRSYRKSWPYFLLVISLVGFVIATIIEVKLQVPVNQQIQALNQDHLSSDNVITLKALTLTHVTIRALLMFISFTLLITGTFAIIGKRPTN